MSLFRRRVEIKLPPRPPETTGPGEPHTFRFEDGESYTLLTNDRLRIEKNGVELERVAPNEYVIRFP